MAIRDHVKLDVLIEKAAALQRVDAELAQLEHSAGAAEATVGGPVPQLRRSARPWSRVLLAVRDSPLGGVLIRSLHGYPPEPAVAGATGDGLGVATVVIISSGAVHTPAQMAALAALRQRPVTSAQAHTRWRRCPRRRPSRLAADLDAGPRAGRCRAGGTGAGTASGRRQRTGARRADGERRGAASSIGTRHLHERRREHTAARHGRQRHLDHRPRRRSSALPKVGHVFEIALSTTRYAAAFGRSRPRRTCARWSRRGRC